MLVVLCASFVCQMYTCEPLPIFLSSLSPSFSLSFSLHILITQLRKKNCLRAQSSVVEQLTFEHLLALTITKDQQQILMAFRKKISIRQNSCLGQAINLLLDYFKEYWNYVHFDDWTSLPTMRWSNEIKFSVKARMYAINEPICWAVIELKLVYFT